jgi:SAM-dependent methyltransferase
VVLAPAERLPFPDGRFDTVVATLVLCTVGDPERALGEIARVLRPGGRLLFLEHVRAEDERLARWQRRLNPIQRRVACGCHLDRPTPELLERSPLHVVRLERERFPKGPATHGQMASGMAVFGP